MPQQKLSFSYSDLERGIHELSLEEQLKLTEIIFANLKTALGIRISLFTGSQTSIPQ